MMKRVVPGAWAVVGFALVLVLQAGLCGAPAQAQGMRVKLKTAVRVKGVNANPLMGHGLVVGLSGTGDSQTAVETQRMLANLLRASGIRLDEQKIRAHNVASVVVTGSLPAYAQNGDDLDVLVSSMGDARSLRGGTLLLTRLETADGAVCAVAQGPISTGLEAGAAGRVQPIAVGRIPRGGVVLHDVNNPVARDGKMQLILREPDFATAQAVAALARKDAPGATVRVVSPAVVEIVLASGEAMDENALMARLGEEELQVETPARVVVNERTGTIVMGGSVRLGAVAISQGGLKVRVRSATVAAVGGLPPPPPPERGPGVHLVQETSTLQDLVDALNALGSSPTELIQVLQALKQAGALQADLEIQ